MHTARTGFLLLAATAGLACGAPQSVPEQGAIVLRLTTAPGAARPDELRVWVYDDGGALWNGVRVPGEGTLASANPPALGTILIQPGMISGALRLHVRAFVGGARTLDGVLAVGATTGAARTIDLLLDAAIPADSDGDDVPDAIDDCVAVANPAQGGCPAPAASDAGDGGDGATDGNPAPDASAADANAPDASDAGADATDAGVDASVDGDAMPMCDGGLASCDKTKGTSCAANGECASGVCADGVCCDVSCAGLCRSCNQPTTVGSCQGYASGTDPERECTTGATCNGAGACTTPPPPPKADGVTCGGANECRSGFCADGVCCNTACDQPCQACGTGTCQSVKKMDDAPQCTGTKTCNAKGACVSG